MDITVDGLKISYKFTGSGETTAVILQGWATSYPLYDVVASCLTSKYRVLQFDLPGFGSSQEPPESWTVDQFTDFFVKLMEALEIKKTVLIGHSYGGRMIIKLVARDNIPFEIENIVLIDSAGVMPKRSFKQKVKVFRYKILKKISDKLILWGGNYFIDFLEHSDGWLIWDKRNDGVSNNFADGVIHRLLDADDVDTVWRVGQHEVNHAPPPP